MSTLLETYPNNLPSQLNCFIGREQEVLEVKQLLTTTRLLTLTGAGGCGKTRLALQVATELVEEFKHGVWWVEFAALSDPLLVPQTVALALSVSEQTGHTLLETLSDTLRPRQLLLVLDNCEHVVTSCAQLTETLLRACPSLHILVTSREVLRLPGETAWPVPSLRMPDPCHLPSVEELATYEAVQLFVERAKAVLPAFTLTYEHAPAIAQICRLLDGLPLAIELAAARIRVLSVEQIAARLDNASRLLTRGNRTALPRQQSLSATFDWSYRLLSLKEQFLFRRLSVFLGSFPLAAAAAVCTGESVDEDDVLNLLSQLVEKSMVLVEQRSGEVRYRLLKTIRQYGQRRLQEAGEAIAVRGRCLAWYAQLEGQAESEFMSSLQVDRFHGSVAAARAERQATALKQAIAIAGQVTVAEQVPPTQEPLTRVTTPTSLQAAVLGGNPFGLTAREMEVLRLVTFGLTYDQIANSLVISPRTAEAHLRSIYRKLGVTSRSAATRAAMEHQLV